MDASIDPRQQLIEEHLEFARMLARQLYGRLPRYVEVEELEADAYLGLMKAADAFDTNRGVIFRTYAARRIRGAILDGLRERGQCRRRVPRPPMQSLEADVFPEDEHPARLADQIVGDADPVGTELEMRDEIGFILERLDPSARQCLVDTYLRGEQGKQIAARLGITGAAISHRLRSARKQIARICREHAA